MADTQQADQVAFSFGSVLPEDIEWEPYPAFPGAASLAVLEGQPSEPGMYTVRVRVRPGAKLPPHWHPEDRVYKVISGIFYIPLGEQFDSEKLQPYPPGAVVFLPGQTRHFHWARAGEYITQVSAVGPLGVEFVDDKRNN
jgi:quercetin dioxygenase-like cupin family protein